MNNLHLKNCMSIFKLGFISLFVLINMSGYVMAIDTASKNSLVDKIEMSLYQDNFEQYSIMPYIGPKKGVVQFGSGITGDKPQIKFRCVYDNIYSHNCLSTAFVKLDRSKIWRECDLSDLANFYYFEEMTGKATSMYIRDLLSGQKSISESFSTAFNCLVWKRYGTLVEDTVSQKYLWGDMVEIPDDKSLTLKMAYEPLEYDINQILTDTNVFNQLQSSHLDLEKTKMIVINNFFILNHYHGFLFYDGESEYYMCPYNTTFSTKDMIGVEAFPGLEEIELSIKKSQLYDVKEDLLPTMLKYYELIQSNP